MKIYVAHSSDFDFTNKLYGPLRASFLFKEHEMLFPMEGPIEEITRDMIKGADAVIAEVSKPSHGAGIEMGWADSFGIPIIAFYEQGCNPSFSIDNVITDRIVYEGPEDMVQKIEAALQKLG